MPTPHETYANLKVFEHPLIQRKLTVARDRRTPPHEFRRLINEIAGLMTYEASRHFETASIEIDTPLERTTGVRLSQPVTLVPILRAGIGMTDGMLMVMPEA
jgi:uracil phosphoribosyltransferase